MTFFRVKSKMSLRKTAGASIGEDPTRWGAEVLKSVASSHPYVELSSANVKFTQSDPTKGSASGWVDIDNKVALAFTIRRDERTNDIKLDPVDVMYDGEQMRSLRESSYMRAMAGDGVGDLFPQGRKGDSYSPEAPSNQYIGHLTGDVTPLNIVPTPGAAGGAGFSKGASLDKEAGCGHEYDQLERVLVGYPSLVRVAKSYGLDPALYALRPRLDVPEVTKMPDVVMLTPGPSGTFYAHTPDGERLGVSGRDLRELIGAEADTKIADMMRKGYVMIRQFPANAAVEVPLPTKAPITIKHPGYYKIEGVPCVVSTQVMSFDGNVASRIKAISYHNRELVAHSAKGVRCEFNPNDVPTMGKPTIGATGCFMGSQNHLPVFSPTVVVESIVGSPDGHLTYIVRRKDTLERCALVPVGELIRPRESLDPFHDLGVVQIPVYYIPVSWTWIDIEAPLVAEDPTAKQKLRESAVVTRSGPLSWSLSSKGGVESFSDTGAMRLKLASMGANDHAIDYASNLNYGQSATIYGVTPAPTKMSLKVASQHVELNDRMRAALTMFKVAASEVAEGMDSATEQGATPDEHSMDAILSMQFVGDEHLTDIVERSDVFAECEDSIARLLLAARMGEESLDDSGLARALRGMGSAGDSIQELKVNLAERGAL